MIWRVGLLFVEEHPSQAALPLSTDQAEGNRPALTVMTHVQDEPHSLFYSRSDLWALDDPFERINPICYLGCRNKASRTDPLIIANNVINKLERSWRWWCVSLNEEIEYQVVARVCAYIYLHTTYKYPVTFHFLHHLLSQLVGWNISNQSQSGQRRCHFLRYVTLLNINLQMLLAKSAQQARERGKQLLLIFKCVWQSRRSKHGNVGNNYSG